MLHALDLYDDDTMILHKQASLTTTERYTRDLSDVVARLIHNSHIPEPKHLRAGYGICLCTNVRYVRVPTGTRHKTCNVPCTWYLVSYTRYVVWYTTLCIEWRSRRWWLANVRVARLSTSTGNMLVQSYWYHI